MTNQIANFLLNIADPVGRTEKFMWKELPGDTFQVFGKSLDMKARIQKKSAWKFDLLLICRDGSQNELGPFRSISQAKKRAEQEYSAWIHRNTIIETDASHN
jgi:hypothetical protein